MEECSGNYLNPSLVVKPLQVAGTIYVILSAEGFLGEFLFIFYVCHRVVFYCVKIYQIISFRKFY